MVNELTLAEFEKNLGTRFLLSLDDVDPLELELAQVSRLGQRKLPQSRTFFAFVSRA